MSHIAVSYTHLLLKRENSDGWSIEYEESGLCSYLNNAESTVGTISIPDRAAQKDVYKRQGAGYELWSKVFNLKQMAQTLNYLSENNLMNIEDLKMCIRDRSYAALSRH